MSYFERTEGGHDNLGNNPEFIPLENLAIDKNDRPDEALMRKQKREEGEEDGEEVEDSIENFANLVDIDQEPSNWEADVEEGKYDNGYIKPEEVVINDEDTVEGIAPVLMQNRQNVVGIEGMKGREQAERYWFADPPSEAKNSKPKEKDIEKDSIRFDEAV